MIKNRFRYILILLIMLVGCTNKDESNNTGEKEQTNLTVMSKKNDELSRRKNTEPIKISIAFWNIDHALSGDHDVMLKQIEDDLNIKIIPYAITHDDDRRKIELWASSAQLPDVVAIDAIGTPLYYHWIQKNIVQPLPEDLSKWPNLNSYMNGTEMSQLKHIDGKFYGIPRKTYDNAHSLKLSGMDRKLFYRYDLAEKSGISKEPETYDDFRIMIKAIIENDFENKHIKGMTFTIPTILDSFFMTYSVPLAMSDGSGSDFNKWIEKDGKYIPAYFAGDLKSALKLARIMYEEETIANDVPLAKEQQSIDRFINGSSAALFGNMITWDLAKRWNEKYPNKKFENCVKILKPLKSKDGNVYGNIYNKYWSESYITTDDSVKQKAILDLYEYFLKHEEMLRRGYEEEDYTSQNGVKIAKPNIDIKKKYPITLIADLVQWNNIHRYLTLTGDPLKDKYFKMDLEYSYKLLETTLPDYYEIDMSIQTLGTRNFTIKPAEDIIRVMLGDESVDRMYEELMEGYEKKGLSDMIEKVNVLIQLNRRERNDK